MATQGVQTFQNFNTYTGVFKADFTIDTTIDAPTVVYLNQQYFYPDGVVVSLHVDGEKVNASQVQIDFSDTRYYTFQVTDELLNGKSLSLKALPL